MELMSIYEEAQKESEKKCGQYFCDSLKEYLINEVGQDKRKMLYLKMVCQEKTDIGTASMAISTAALILAYGSMVAGCFEYGNVCKIVLPILVIIAVIVTWKIYRKWNKEKKKYNRILMILNEIEKSM